MEPDFDLNIYRQYNDDLKELSDDQLLAHVKTFGKLENRVRNQADVDRYLVDFDINGYRTLNPDLSLITDDELKIHWVKYGKNEGRFHTTEKDYSLSAKDLEYVRKVDYKKVIKSIEELTERVCNYQGKINITDLKKEKVAVFILECINKTDKSLPLDTKRYLFAYALPLFFDYLYNVGVIYFDDFVAWKEIAKRDVGLFDEINVV